MQWLATGVILGLPVVELHINACKRMLLAMPLPMEPPLELPWCDDLAILALAGDVTGAPALYEHHALQALMLKVCMKSPT